MSARHPRAFTLIETMLAAALGALVLMGIMGVTALVDRAESSSAARLERTSELEQAQTVIRRALGSLAMAGGSAPVQQNRSAQPAEESDAGGSTAGLTFTPTPRLVLAPMEMDASEAVMLGEELADVSSGPQRLQFALTMLPLPEKAFLAPSLVTSRTGLTSKTEAPEETEAPSIDDTTEPLPEEAVEETDTAAASELVPIFWGVLELTPPDPRAIESNEEGWTLWWRQIPAPANESAAVFGLQTPAAPQITDPRMDPGAIALVRGISMCKWSVYRGRQLLPAHAATYSSELPAYIQLELRTRAGVYANWMFELGWATVQEPGQVAANRAAAQLRAERGAADGEERSRRDGAIGRPGGGGEGRERGRGSMRPGGAPVRGVDRGAPVSERGRGGGRGGGSQ